MWVSQVGTIKIGNHMFMKKEILYRFLLGKVCIPNHITALIDKTNIK